MKKTTQKHFRSVFKVKDEKFEVDKIGSYDLALYIGDKHFKSAVVSQKEARCVFFESFEFTKELKSSDKLEQIKLIFDEHEILQAGFWQSVRCVINSDFFTLLPVELFDSKKAESVLKYHYSDADDKKYSFHAYKPNSGPASSLFYLEKEVEGLISSYYPKIKVKYLHVLSCILEGILNSTTVNSDNQVYAYFKSDNVSIFIQNSGKLIFSNSFRFNAYEDAIYHILNAIRNSGLNLTDVSIEYYGDIMKSSDIIKKLSSFVSDIKEGERPKLFYYNFEFDEIPTQWHFETFCSYMCK